MYYYIYIYILLTFFQLSIDEMSWNLQEQMQSIEKLWNLLPTNDPVLESLENKIKDYHSLLPLLKQLSSKAIKVRKQHFPMT